LYSVAVPVFLVVLNPSGRVSKVKLAALTNLCRETAASYAWFANQLYDVALAALDVVVDGF